MRPRAGRLTIRALMMTVVLPVLLLLPAGVVSADDELFEYYSGSFEGTTNIGGGQQVVQTFTAASDHAVSKVEL